MERFEVEYLLRISNSEAHCSSIKYMSNLLAVDPEITLNEEKNEIIYKEVNINYNIKLYNGVDKKKIFCLTFILENVKEEKLDKLEVFEKFLRIVKGIIYKFSNEGLLLMQDDLSLYYSKLSYPMFNEIENLMRKLLTKFMVIKVGEDWDKNNTPKNVKELQSSDKNRLRYKFLYTSNFDSLSNFLFSPYRNKDISNLNYDLNNCNSVSDINEMKIDYVEKSNWQRYFRKIVNAEDTELEKMWKQLYEYRCKIAHNNEFTRIDFSNVKDIMNKLKPIIVSAIDQIDKIDISNEDRKIFTENIVMNINELSGIFIKKFIEIEYLIRTLYKGKGKFPLLMIVKSMEEIKDIEPDIKRIMRLRNKLVHFNEDEEPIDEAILLKYIKKMEEIKSELYKKIENKSS